MEPTRREELIARLAARSAEPLAPIPTELEPDVRSLEGIRAVLFDVYGTLFVSASGDIGTSAAEAREEALAYAFRAAGVDTANGADLLRRASQLLVATIQAAHGLAREKGCLHPEVDILEIWLTVHRSLASEGLPSVPAANLEAFALDYECRHNPVWPMPEAVATLSALRDRKVHLGIVSNAQFYTELLFPALLGRTVEELGFAPELTIWSYRAREAKPSPQLFALDPQQPVLSRHEVLFVGNDMLNDVWAASRAGLRTALFAGDERSLRLRGDDPRIAGCRPDVVVTELPQLLTVVG